MPTNAGFTAESILRGHTSEETAYVVDDYPYGFRLRCKIRYWLETNAKHGDRFCSQTTNPKVEGERWNKPKKSTYVDIGAMFLDPATGHVEWTGVSSWTEDDVLDSFLAAVGPDLNPAQRTKLAYIIGIKRVQERVKVTIHQGPFTPEEQAEQDEIKRNINRQVHIEAHRARSETGF